MLDEVIQRYDRKGMDYKRDQILDVIGEMRRDVRRDAIDVRGNGAGNGKGV